MPSYIGFTWTQNQELAVSNPHKDAIQVVGSPCTVAERMPELTLLLIGEWHEAESGRDEDFQACRAAPNLIWLGRRSDEEL